MIYTLNNSMGHANEYRSGRIRVGGKSIKYTIKVDDGIAMKINLHYFEVINDEVMKTIIEFEPTGFDNRIKLNVSIRDAITNIAANSRMCINYKIPVETEIIPYDTIMKYINCILEEEKLELILDYESEDK